MRDPMVPLIARYVVEAWGVKGVEDLNNSLTALVPFFNPIDVPKDSNAKLATIVTMTEKTADKVWQYAEFYGTFSITPATRL